MDNVSDNRLYSLNVPLDLGNLCVTDLTDIGKPKVSWYRDDQF